MRQIDLRRLYAVALISACVLSVQAQVPSPVITLGLGEDISAKAVTPASGWVLVRSGESGQNHLLWTRDAGADWADITPPLGSQQSLQAVFFLNDSQGWAVLATFGAAPSGNAAVVIADTEDQGRTWTESAFTAAPEDLLANYGGATITFADSAHVG